MHISELLVKAQLGRVRIRLSDGQVHTGHFRTDILSEHAVSAFFFGDMRPLSLTVGDIVEVEPLMPTESIASDAARSRTSRVTSIFRGYGLDEAR